ncbi:hypothetical protein [Chryseobacterium rhizosphaerae]|uniref:hypothetical protein n=1 Tax=Chryseobacterium rhizosphaerae TaxID=395937 RepID=UPI0023585154|nr:hypothetical protein [Chryseobacterium rhizosphaerae]MDC8099643.1 hypothetical protein [Chryseobacterium rhizosphaerae]
MKKLVLFFWIFLVGGIVSAQEKKKDTVIHQYKPRIFYPYDCSCPGKVIYKELKPGDKEFNPYEYKEQKPIPLDSLYNKKDLPFI